MGTDRTITRLLPLSFALLLAAGLSVHAQAGRKSGARTPARSAEAVKRLGAFTNMRFTGEHQSGYSVELWQERGKLFGLFLASAGLAGDTPAGLLEDVVFDPKTGKLTFGARLSTGSTFGANNEQVPTRDVYRFSGVLTDQRLAGVLEHADALNRSAAGTKTRVSLTRSRSESESMAGAKSYDEWRRWADEILKLRGPKW